MIPVEDGSELMRYFVARSFLEIKERLTNNDLMQLMEIDERIKILTTSKEIMGNPPRDNSEINGHYQAFKYFLETLQFATVSQMKVLEKREKNITAYKDMIISIAGMRKQLFEDLKKKKIENAEGYTLAIKKINEICLIKWTNLRDTLQKIEEPQTEEKEGEK